MRQTFVVLVWFCITFTTFCARITTIGLYLPKLYLKHYWSHFFPDTVYYYYNHFMAVCPGLPRWAGTRRNMHPPIPIQIINHPLSASFINYDHGILPVQFTCLTVFLHNLSSSLLRSTSWSSTLHFILHTFFHPATVFFSQQHMPISLQPI